MRAVGPVPAGTPEAPEVADDVAAEGPGIDPELLRLIQRVAHREHLLDGSARPRTTVSTRSARRRPAIGVVRTATPVRTTPGTTARKVTWS